MSQAFCTTTKFDRLGLEGLQLATEAFLQETVRVAAVMAQMANRECITREDVKNARRL